MKVFAFYLPQFHTIPENDLWWGKGFTEWTNVRYAEKIIEKHTQPKIPLGNNYYNLLDTETFSSQVKMAKENGVSGFCFYHYWFNGKLLLEKPLESFLKDKSLNIEFCFSWANEPWTKAWDGRDKDILMPQEYGSESDWLLHYEYLKVFFKDNRYLKINNCPVFVIYRSSSITPLQEMFNFLNNLAKKDGFDGICFISTKNSFEENDDRYNFDYSIEFEPMYTLKYKMPKWFYLYKSLYYKFYRLFKSFLSKESGVDQIDYNLVWDSILKRKVSSNVFLGAFPSWDNSPRKKYRSTIITGSSPEKFESYLTEQISRGVKNNIPFLFINAWNEWAEGAYLEPDEHSKYGYLQSVKKALENNNLPIDRVSSKSDE